MELLYNSLTVDLCKKKLIRASWRLQYRSRKRIKYENNNLNDYLVNGNSFEEEVTSMLNLKYLLGKISSDRARYIIIRIILQKATEKQVSKELKISQQAVSKCKVKTLNLLRKMMSNLD